MNTPIGMTMPARDKYWPEKAIEEKLEVVAGLLAEAHREIHNLTNRIDEFLLHVHHPMNGQLLVPPRDPPEFSRYPRGYCREDFLLGRAPADHYGPSPAVAQPSWAGEAKAEGALPESPPAPAPATGPENQPEKGSEIPVYPTSSPLEDPDWPKPAPNPHFHPKVDER